MKLLRVIIKSKNFWPIVIVLIFGVLAGRTLFGEGYFNMHDDLQLMRQLQMEKCFGDGQIPCRWVPDMGYGFGFPLFNFYPPLPYLIGQGIRVAGYSFISTAKGLFALSFIISGITMYFFSREFFGRLGGVVSAIVYVWAPYHAVDVFVRGAMNESWALAWFPLILWTSYKLIKEKKKLLKWVIWLALSWFALLTSHNLMVIIFGPVFAIWTLLWLWRYRAWERIPQLVISGIWAGLLAAFFTIPAILENGLTHIESVLVGYYDFSAHFVTVRQLFITRFWGYGPSVWGDIDDGMPFQAGHIHWIASLVIGVLLVRRYIKNKKIDDFFIVVTFMILLGWGAAFLAHSRSTPIWLIVSQMRFIQFPWRFLTMVIFGFSFALGAVPQLLEKIKVVAKYRLLISIALVVGLVAFNWNYFRPELGKLGPLTDDEKLSGVAWDLQQTAGIFDYLPKTAVTAPKEPQRNLAEFVDVDGEKLDKADQITNPTQDSDSASFDIVIEEESSFVRLGIFEFPGWKVFIDGTQVETSVPEAEAWGRMWIKVPQGEHHVTAEFTNTPPRTIGNYLSLVGVASLITTPVWSKRVNFDKIHWRKK